MTDIHQDRWGNDHGTTMCLMDHLCRVMGFQFAIDYFPRPPNMVNVETVVFTLDEISCTFKANATDDKSSPSFRLTKSNKAKVDKSKQRNGEMKAIILLCGPVPEVCPITETENFLKKSLLRGFWYNSPAMSLLKNRVHLYCLPRST